jgi:hypothetical protein
MSNAGESVASLGRRLPEIYSAMVKPRPLPEKLTVQELYEKFSDDTRDDSWAYPMELGINEHIAQHGNELGVAFEFVECKSRYCTIAGVAYEGSQSEVNKFVADMTQGGWWQTTGENHTAAFGTDTEYRFVSIFPRTNDDSARDQSSGQSASENNQYVVGY